MLEENGDVPFWLNFSFFLLCFHLGESRIRSLKIQYITCCHGYQYRCKRPFHAWRVKKLHLVQPHSFYSWSSTSGRSIDKSATRRSKHTIIANKLAWIYRSKFHFSEFKENIFILQSLVVLYNRCNKLKTRLCFVLSSLFVKHSIFWYATRFAFSTR